MKNASSNLEPSTINTSRARTTAAGRGRLRSAQRRCSRSNSAINTR
jgi:hypothetical protein